MCLGDKYTTIGHVALWCAAAGHLAACYFPTLYRWAYGSGFGFVDLHSHSAFRYRVFGFTRVMFLSYPLSLDKREFAHWQG